ncbi:Rab-GAP/TBC domain protein [Metarhizium album ARSEF 1941]|uniref:Rab-GAP/TBC domain protein n=1 Tax=Metarhizium album (strain ARSEF 1941) TaxID=1081103 RepID=A0A0B2WUX8_METAS|nr:Rab-GAP/TBC domain protein [Metarhizium album ARSEF 1941]KHN97878.1 Rab-GAP/TBC domain protein [Metarhizium album ARSEF 1941]
MHSNPESPEGLARSDCRRGSSAVRRGSQSPTARKALEDKAEAVRDACKWKDIARLRSLAESTGGLLNDELRRSAWPILLGLPPDLLNDQEAVTDWAQLTPHRDEDQVQLDVNRSFIYYPNDKSEAQLEKCKSELLALIVEVLRRHPYLCYFQGFHDICQVFLLVLQPGWRPHVVARLSILRIRDFMLPSLGPTTAQLRLIPDLLAKADSELRKHIATIEPFYALAGTLTMYAHNIEAYSDIARLFDVFLAREAVFPIYVFAQIIMARRTEILDVEEPDMLQVMLAKVPPNMDLDALITNAVSLFDQFPPESLPSWRQISKSSTLKTARHLETCAKQSLEDGRVFFEDQAKEVRWVESRDRISAAVWRCRRSIKAIAMTTAVAAFAFYLRRNPSAIHYVVSLFNTLSKAQV